MYRLLLAAMHYNENSHRVQATNKDNELRYNIRFPKYKKGEYSVVPVKQDPTFGKFDSFTFHKLNNQSLF
jgi:hypothetical protein